MSELLYKYNPGDPVWARHDNEIVRCIVCKAVFEIDPDSTGGVTEEKTYHLDIVGDANAKIILRDESEVYESALDAIEESPPLILSNSILYEFNVNDLVWSYTGSYLDIEALVKQITFTLNQDGVKKLYHILPTNNEYQTLVQDSSIIFATQQEALDAIATIITPTPTMTVTPTLTPTETPEITPTITPTMLPSQTVTPNPTTTPTLSG